MSTVNKLSHSESAQDVLDLMNIRREESYVPDPNTTGPKLGLIVEGGGMRGVMSSAAIDAIHQLGYKNCFDCIYGTSAGAINGAFFIADQINIGTSVYYEDISNKNFINKFRWPDFMDLDFLFSILTESEKKLNVDDVIKSPQKMSITTTDRDTGEAVLFSGETLTKETLVPAMKASASTPMFTTHAEQINGRYLNDGLLRDGIPLKPALDDGCTHLVCVLTRPYGYRKRKTLLISLFEKFRLRNYSKAYKKAFDDRIGIYNYDLDMIFGDAKNEPSISYLPIFPESEDVMVSNGEIREEVLYQSAKYAMSRTAEMLDENARGLKTFREQS